MDNYPQINLRRVLKGVDFGTFYNLVKTKPEIVEVLTSYDFDEGQIKQIVQAFLWGLTLEQIKSCAITDFASSQMLCIYTSYKEGLTIEQLTIALNPAFCVRQMNWIIYGIKKGFEEKKIKLFAKPEFEADQMQEIYFALLDGLGIMKIRLFAKPEFTAAQMKLIRLAFTSFESKLSYKQVKVIANHKFSEKQMEKLVDAYQVHELTIEEVEKIAKVEYSPDQMQEIISAYVEGYTDKQMAFLLNPELDDYQMSAIHTALERGLTNGQIATFAIHLYDYEHMEIIIEAYCYGVQTYVDLLLNPEFEVSQVDTIWELCKDGLLSTEQIKYLANPKITSFKMDEIARWFYDDFSIEQVEEYVDKFNVRQLEKIRYGLWNKLDHLDLWVNPEFDECQMQEVIRGIEKGFTREQLLLYAKSQIPVRHMWKIRCDIECGVPMEKVALYAKCIDAEEFDKEREKVLYEEIKKLIK